MRRFSQELQLPHFPKKHGKYCRKNSKAPSSKVIAVKLQTLISELEVLLMKGNETLQDFLSRVILIISQMRSYGKKITDAIIVLKVLRSLTPKYDYIVTVIEEAKDLSILSFDELMGSLQAHVARRNRSAEKDEEKTFQASQVKGEIEKKKKKDFACRGRGRGGFRGRGRVRLGDNKQIQVEGKGTIAVEISDGKVKLLYNVYFVPSLAHSLLSVGQLMMGGYAIVFDNSLLSVGQLMMGGYAIVFDNGACVISDKDSGKSIKKSEKCIFVGYCNQSKAYRLYNPLIGKLIIRRDIDFDENSKRNWNTQGEETRIHIPMEDRTPTTECVESSPLESPIPSPSNSRSSSSSSLQESSDEAPSSKG
ncbi:hypothetical protein ZIOFF_065498 [Zingiber officinale]|uniref:Gag-pol polyprotein n=1 Tax=Zingiber officinale TaxID=94328 RepID=A0A8J5EX71_ZINOF|nr:hypothetical protein ZIOFF_065498 [Zingiber officinale]